MYFPKSFQSSVLLSSNFSTFKQISSYLQSQYSRMPIPRFTYPADVVGQSDSEGESSPPSPPDLATRSSGPTSSVPTSEDHASDANRNDAGSSSSLFSDPNDRVRRILLPRYWMFCDTYGEILCQWTRDVLVAGNATQTLIDSLRGIHIMFRSQVQRLVTEAVHHLETFILQRASQATHLRVHPNTIPMLDAFSRVLSAVEMTPERTLWARLINTHTGFYVARIAEGLSGEDTPPVPAAAGPLRSLRTSFSNRRGPAFVSSTSSDFPDGSEDEDEITRPNQMNPSRVSTSRTTPAWQSEVPTYSHIEYAHPRDSNSSNSISVTDTPQRQWPEFLSQVESIFQFTHPQRGWSLNPILSEMQAAFRNSEELPNLRREASVLNSAPEPLLGHARPELSGPQLGDAPDAPDALADPIPVNSALAAPTAAPYVPGPATNASRENARRPWSDAQYAALQRQINIRVSREAAAHAAESAVNAGSSAPQSTGPANRDFIQELLGPGFSLEAAQTAAMDFPATRAPESSTIPVFSPPPTLPPLPDTPPPVPATLPSIIVTPPVTPNTPPSPALTAQNNPRPVDSNGNPIPNPYLDVPDQLAHDRLVLENLLDFMSRNRLP